MSSRVTLTVHLKRQHLLYTCYVHLLYIKVCLLRSLRVQWNMLVAFSHRAKGSASRREVSAKTLLSPCVDGPSEYPKFEGLQILGGFPFRGRCQHSPWCSMKAQRASQDCCLRLASHLALVICQSPSWPLSKNSWDCWAAWRKGKVSGCTTKNLRVRALVCINSLPFLMLQMSKWEQVLMLISLFVI